MIRKPPKLQVGDVLGVVAPSLPMFRDDLETYRKGVEVLREFGFKILEGKTLRLQHWWSAGTRQQQADDINEMYANPDIKGIVAHTGGFSSMGVLDLLNYDLIREHPKPFLGMSDITAYQWAMFAKCRLVGFQGNDVTFGFGKHFLEASIAVKEYHRHLYTQLLTSDEPLGEIRRQSQWACWRPGIARGRLMGGNLKRFVMLAGTDYFPPLKDFDGAILYWEEIGETYYDIALNLYKLAHLGIFERIAGMLIGRPVWVNTYFEAVDHPTLKEMVLDIVGGCDFPILAHVDFGHHISMVPLPIGLEAEMDATSLRLAILEGAVL